MNVLRKFDRRRIFITIGFFLFLFGCASTENVGQSWVGYSESQLFMEWGAPTRSATSGDTTIQTWNRRNGYGRVTCQQNMVVRYESVVGHSSNCGFGFIK